VPSADLGTWPLARRAALLRSMAEGIEARAAAFATPCRRGDRTRPAPPPQRDPPHGRPASPLRRGARGGFVPRCHRRPRRPRPPTDSAAGSEPDAATHRPGRPFAPSNFPFAFSVAGGDSAAALPRAARSSSRRTKAIPRTSARTAELIVEALDDSGAAPGTFAIVYGRDGAGAGHRSPRPSGRLHRIVAWRSGAV
jgi:hypothetical protein